uniref:THO complex subunit 7 homolog n=1 Tax=Schistocephalus solidus TaxID=70667 RepID=A0A0V0J6X6_SCHSO
MGSVSDDDIIKRRLLIEGESGNDDRRFTLLLKNFLRWVSCDESEEDSQFTYNSLMASVSQCENAMEQALLIQSMNFEQSQKYDELLEEIKQATEDTKLKILGSREKLKEAKVIRKNRQEYHNLAKIINEHPNRKETLCKISKLKEQLTGLQRINEKYDETILLRKKQFHLFLVALRGLQKLVDQDNSSTDLIGQNNEASSAQIVVDSHNAQMDTT